MQKQQRKNTGFVWVEEAGLEAQCKEEEEEEEGEEEEEEDEEDEEEDEEEEEEETAKNDNTRGGGGLCEQSQSDICLGLLPKLRMQLKRILRI
jgi:hypothetical protein